MADRVTFTPGSADRIAKVVRRVEAGNRDATGYVASPRLQGGGGGKPVRLATYSGSWSIDATKTVTFANQTATPNTASVLNSLLALPDAGERKCVIAKEGTAWHLVNWQWNTAVIATAATVEDGSLKFIGVPGGALATTTQHAFSLALQSAAAVENVNLTGNALSFERKSLTVLATGDATNATIDVSDCPTAQASAQALSFFN